jgi:CheY-like chemotaxis protein
LKWVRENSLLALQNTSNGLFRTQSRSSILKAGALTQFPAGAGTTISVKGPVDYEAKPVRVLIVDDFAQIRSGLKRLIEKKPFLEVVGEAADGAEAVRLVEELSPDAVLMDVRMPVMDGFQATAEITARWPQVRVLALSSAGDLESIVAMSKAGARGYLLKGAPIAEIVEALTDEGGSIELDAGDHEDGQYRL